MTMTFKGSSISQVIVTFILGVSFVLTAHHHKFGWAALCLWFLIDSEFALHKGA